MAQTLRARMREAEKTEKNHIYMAVNIGISLDTLRRIFKGEKPKQFDKIALVDKYLAKKGV